LEGSGEAAAVEEEHDLLASFEALKDGFVEGVGEDGWALGLAGFGAEVDHADDGKLGVIGADGEFEEVVFAVASVVIAFDGGGGGAEDDGGSGLAGTDDGDIAGVVPGGFLLFVGMLVFLVDDDQSEGFGGGEDGGASADDDAGTALADFMPFVMAFTGGEMGVEDGDEGAMGAVVEAGLEAFDGLGGEGDFGDEDNGGIPAGEAFGDGLEVHFGFAGAGDAVEEKDAGVRARGSGGVNRGGKGGRQVGEDGLKGVGLVGVEGEGLGGEDQGIVVGIAFGDFRGDADEAEVFESADGGGGGAGEAEEFLEGKVAPFLHEMAEFLLALGQGGGWVSGRDIAHAQAFAPAGLFLSDSIGEGGFEGGFEGAAVIGGDPAGEFEDGGGELGLGAEDLGDGFEVGMG
jgi:hypothetical protein